MLAASLEDEVMPIYVDGEKVSFARFAKLSAATTVWVYNCPALTALPELPAATDVRVDNCPGLKR